MPAVRFVTVRPSIWTKNRPGGAGSSVKLPRLSVTARKLSSIPSTEMVTPPKGRVEVVRPQHGLIRQRQGKVNGRFSRDRHVRLRVHWRTAGDVEQRSIAGIQRIESARMPQFGDIVQAITIGVERLGDGHL